MATSKEKKRYHLTATSDGWVDAGSSEMGSEGKLAAAASLQKGLRPPLPAVPEKGKRR